MQESGDADREELPGLQNVKVRGRSLRTWVVSAGAIALAISALFGGLKKASDETPKLVAGTALDTGRYEVTVQRVVVVSDLKPLFSPDKGGALIAVVTKLKLTDGTGVTAPGDVVRLIGVPGIKDDDRPLGTTNLRDQTMSPVLTPEYGEDVAYVWKLPKATGLPKEVKVVVQHYEHIDDSVLDHHEKWNPDKVAAEGTVAVKDNRK